MAAIRLGLIARLCANLLRFFPPQRASRGRQPAPARHTEVTSRRSVFCFGPLDRRKQGEVARMLRVRPTEVGRASTDAMPLNAPVAGLKRRFPRSTHSRRKAFGI